MAITTKSSIILIKKYIICITLFISYVFILMYILINLKHNILINLLLYTMVLNLIIRFIKKIEV